MPPRRLGYNWTDRKTTTVEVSEKVPKPWYKKYWWSIPLGLMAIGAVTYVVRR